MHELSEQEVEIVAQRISVSITSEQLQLELIDHCCSRIEELMAENQSFENAFNSALNELSPDGLHLIQEEWNFQTNLKKQPMKITLYVSGFLASFGILLGFLFKLMHWPGANAILTLGDSMLIVAMIGLLIPTLANRKSLSKSAFARMLAGGVGGTLFGFGAFFKLMHWPFASLLIVLGTATVLLGFLPLFFFELYRKEMSAQSN